MAGKPKPGPTQRTAKGHEIPVPKRGEFDRNLDKLLKAPPPPTGYRKKPRSADRPTSSGE